MAHTLQFSLQAEKSMPARQKIDLDKVIASLNAPCPKCGHGITPAGINRVTWDEIKCPKYGLVFDPRRKP